MGEAALLPRLIVIVTGANGGVGYGICQRLLLQLCQTTPPDSRPQSFASKFASNESTKPTRYNGVTLIMACRNMKRADAARTKLLQWLDGRLEQRKERMREDGEYVRSFREGCDVLIEELDLANLSSVVRFAATMDRTVPYVSHVVFNAGVASFCGIDWIPCLGQLLRNPMAAVTAPVYYLQRTGETSADNLGWVWQSNVFGHFTLFRELEHLLAKTPFTPARVIWSSSLEASPIFYDSEDWQLVKTKHSYESSKYQIDLIATHLDRLAPPSSTRTIRHYISEPGVCSTMISQGLIGPVMNLVKILVFYIARFFGSPHHTISPFKAAIAAVHLILVPLAFIPNEAPVRYGARTDWWGCEHVSTSPVKEWVAHQAESAALVEKCDALYSEMKKAETASTDA